MAENEGQKKTKSTSDTHIQNLVFVPQGCSYFLDTTDSKENDQQQRQYMGLITQGCGPCACIIVRNKDNTKMVLAHVDSGNDITDEEFGLPKWVKQCKGDIDNNNRDNDNNNNGNNNGNNNNNVIVEVHIGCGQIEIKGQDNPKKLEQAILGFERTIRQLRDRLNFTYNGHDQSPGSQGGMILKNGYRMVIDQIEQTIKITSSKHNKQGANQKLEQQTDIKVTKNFYKILQKSAIKPTIKNGRRIILNEQISFDKGLTKAIFEKIEEPISENVDDIIKHTKRDITNYIENTLNLSDGTEANSAFCQEHNIKVPPIPLDEIDKFENGLTEEFKNRIDNQPYIKSRIEEQKKEELQKQKEQEKELKQQEQLKEEELRQEQRPEQLEEENHTNEQLHQQSWQKRFPKRKGLFKETS